MRLRTAALQACALLALAPLPRSAGAQAARPLSLEDARAAARRASPDIAAARSAVDAAYARMRQGGSRTNPTVSYAHEQTAAGGQRTSQSIAALEQPIEVTGVRGARQEAARLRWEAAEADLRAVEDQVGLEATRAYVLALAADARLALAERTVAAFDRAERVTGARLAAGDVSGYQARRLRLEAARYAVLRVEAALARRTAFITLAALIAAPADSMILVPLAPASGLPPVIRRDSVIAMAHRRRAELVAAERRAGASQADARAARRERIPVPVASAGWKSERPASGGARFHGFVAGISLPLPLLDRRAGAVAAADAEARRQFIEVDLVRRRITREAEEAYAALRASMDATVRFSQELTNDAGAALRAAETAYTEGEITLVEWLDAVRAYQETGFISATVHADLHVRRAALERATGGTLFEDRQP